MNFLAKGLYDKVANYLQFADNINTIYKAHWEKEKRQIDTKQQNMDEVEHTHCFLKSLKFDEFTRICN